MTGSSAFKRLGSVPLAPFPWSDYKNNGACNFADKVDVDLSLTWTCLKLGSTETHQREGPSMQWGFKPTPWMNVTPRFSPFFSGTEGHRLSGHQTTSGTSDGLTFSQSRLIYIFFFTSRYKCKRAFFSPLGEVRFLESDYSGSSFSVQSVKVKFCFFSPPSFF